jgi:hypothetical protein
VLAVKKLTIRIDEDTYEDLRQLALTKETTMAGLVRYATDKTFEDELEIIGANRALEEAERNPDSTITIQEHVASMPGAELRKRSR